MNTSERAECGQLAHSINALLPALSSSIGLTEPTWPDWSTRNVSETPTEACVRV
jgi:hypothetical protein